MQDSIAKEKNGVKRCLEICAIKGGVGVGRLMANTILNFHFDYPHPSLILGIEALLIQSQTRHNSRIIFVYIDTASDVVYDKVQWGTEVQFSKWF